MALDTKDNVVGYTLHENRYLNVSNRCNLYCHFCPRMENDWDVQGIDLNLRSEPSTEELIEAAGDVSEYEEIVFCGLGEPTLRLDVLLEVGEALKKRGARIRLNTNGLANQYHGRDVTSELARVIDNVSISLNAQNAEIYQRHCKPRQAGAYEAVLDFIQHAKKTFAEVSLTAIEGLEGVDITACKKIADEFGVGFRKRVLDIVG